MFSNKVLVMIKRTVIKYLSFKVGEPVKLVESRKIILKEINYMT